MKETKHPPKLVELLLRLFCRKEYKEEVLGDFLEIYDWRVNTKGKMAADLRSWIDAIVAIRLMKIQNSTTVKLNFFAMISFKVTIRTFMRNKLHTAINLFGLACGFMVFLAVFQYVQFERSYDSFNAGADQIYRINNILTRDNIPVFKSSASLPPMGKEAMISVPGVEQYGKLFHDGVINSCVITLGDDAQRSFKETGLMFATSSIPELIALNFLEGDYRSVLDEPNEVIISRSLQEKYFQGASALGKTLVFDSDERNHHVLKVSGVFEDYPGNSHLSFDMLVSYKTLFTRDGRRDETPRFTYEEDWEGRHQFITYLKINPGTNLKQITDALESKANAAISYPGYAYEFELQSISDIHLSDALRGDVKASGDARRINTLLVLGLAVLILAWVNFVNLTTATALGRAKETGIRKVLGGTRKQLVWQFMFESVFTGVLAFALGLLLFHFAYPTFNNFLPISDKWFLFRNTPDIITLLVVCLGSGLLAGIYPAFVLSGFKPVMVLKGIFKSSKSGLRVRRFLVVTQGGISVLLITGVLAITSQVSYMIENSQGMDTEQVLVIEKPGNVSQLKNRGHNVKALFNAQLTDKPFVVGYSATDGLPGSRLRKSLDINLTEIEENEIDASLVNVEYDYLKTLGIDLIAGRDFGDVSAETKTYIVNESAVYALGLDSPDEILNRRIYDGDEWRTVIGVIADYHHTSLKSGIVPMVIAKRDYGHDYHLIKMNGGDLASNLGEIESVFKNVFPGNPFEYYFLDDHFESNYQEEKRFGESFAFFAVVAILIAAIGLFSLSSFITMSRVKEIGIRKVLGARAVTIVNQLNKEFMMLVLLAVVVATPAAIWLVEEWLSEFPYRITPGIIFFLMPGVILMGFSLASVSLKTIAAARVNPVKLLHRE